MVNFYHIWIEVIFLGLVQLAFISAADNGENGKLGMWLKIDYLMPAFILIVVSFQGSSPIFRESLRSNIHISSTARPTLYACLSPFVINDYSLSISTPWRKRRCFNLEVEVLMPYDCLYNPPTVCTIPIRVTTIKATSILNFGCIVLLHKTEINLR